MLEHELLRGKSLVFRCCILMSQDLRYRKDRGLNRDLGQPYLPVASNSYSSKEYLHDIVVKIFTKALICLWQEDQSDLLNLKEILAA